MPLFFGPNYRKFQEAVDLCERGLAFSVADGAELMARFAPLWESEKYRLRLQDQMLDYVHGQAGATRTILAALPGITAP